MNRPLALAAAVLGFTGVALGALGAHALERAVVGLPDAARRLAWWETAARYHLIHALALLGVAALAQAAPGRLARSSGAAFVLGIALFSGSLYVMGATGERALGMVTPFGGLAFLAGWTFAAAAAWKLPRR